MAATMVELLVLTEARAGLEAGDVVTVQEGGHPWGTHECVPPFGRYAVPGAVADYLYLTDAEEALPDPDGVAPPTRPRLSGLNLALLPGMDRLAPGHVATVSRAQLLLAVVARR